MIKLALILLMAFFASKAFCQTSNSSITYTGEAVYMILLDDNMKEVTKKPLGKTPYIIYDTFFKNYTIFYYDQNGTQQGASFSYINTDENGFIRMKQMETIFLVFDKISESGKLLFMSEGKIGNYTSMLLFENVSLRKSSN